MNGSPHLRSSSPGSCTMLIVEDDLKTQDTLRDVVSRKYPNLCLHFASDGEEGLTLFRELAPEIVLTDLSMPRMNGLRMAAEIRSSTPQVQIIVLTASNDTSQILQSISIGITRYILKPIDFAKLFEAIEDAVRRVDDAQGRERAEQALRDHKDHLEVLVRERTAEIDTLNADLEQRVKERTAELEAAMREQEAFSYSVSHDLRAPLRHINCYSSMLADLLGNDISPEAQGYVDRITAATQRMAHLIDHLLELSRIGRSKLLRHKVNLSAVAESVETMLRETEPERCVKFSIDEGLYVRGDQVLLRQLLENLLHNAWKYTSGKTEAFIQIGRSSMDTKECFFVKDNGIGFDMMYSHKLFKIFERLHSGEFKGEGIGLAIVHRIILRHGGLIWAESAPDEGATFYFTLG